MLGSFFMGLAASASTLKIKNASKAVGALPHSSPWQANSALHVGVRTGYCGSLTTFASWELAMVQLLIGGKAGPPRTLSRGSPGSAALQAPAQLQQTGCTALQHRFLPDNRQTRALTEPTQGRDGGQWPGFFWGLIVGYQLALSSYAFGMHAALFVHHHLLRERAPDRPGTTDPRKEELTEDLEAQDAGGVAGVHAGWGACLLQPSGAARPSRRCQCPAAHCMAPALASLGSRWTAAAGQARPGADAARRDAASGEDDAKEEAAASQQNGGRGVNSSVLDGQASGGAPASSLMGTQDGLPQGSSRWGSACHVGRWHTSGCHIYTPSCWQPGLVHPSAGPTGRAFQVAGSPSCRAQRRACAAPPASEPSLATRHQAGCRCVQPHTCCATVGLPQAASTVLGSQLLLQTLHPSRQQPSAQSRAGSRALAAGERCSPAPGQPW